MGDMDSAVNVTSIADRLHDGDRGDIVLSDAIDRLNLSDKELATKCSTDRHCDTLVSECLKSCVVEDDAEINSLSMTAEQEKYSEVSHLSSVKADDTNAFNSTSQRLDESCSSDSENEMFEDAMQEHYPSTSKDSCDRCDGDRQNNLSPEVRWDEEFPPGCTDKVLIDVDGNKEKNTRSTPEPDLNDLLDADELQATEPVIDEEFLKEKEALLTEDERQARLTECRRLKEAGNEEFKSGAYEVAASLYTDALVACLISAATDRSVLYANRAAAYMKLEKYKEAIADSSLALKLNPDYMKALLRRAELYERTDKLDEALADYQKALDRDPSLHQARAACMRLPDQINVRNEKMKTEMLDKLKDLGNMILRPFGLSTNNFQLQQDPNTGSYSVSFQQQPQQ